MKRLILCLLLGLTLTLTGCTKKGDNNTQNTGTQQETGRYESSDISFEYPTNWTMKESDTPLGRVIILYAPNQEGQSFQANLNVILQDLSGQDTPTLEEYTQVSKNSLPEIVEGLTILNEKAIEIDGNDGFEISYRGSTKTNPNQQFQWWQAWALAQDEAYIFTLTGSPDNVSDFAEVAEQVVGSFKIK